MLAIPRLVLAAPHGRSGKTTVTLGLSAALVGRGLRVQPFKKGPDYIDPSWLTAVAGRPCRNLDPFMMPEEVILDSFCRAGEDSDLALVEGNHGLYDGLDEQGTSGSPRPPCATGSTAAMARLLGAPVLLVVDAARMTRSVAALIRGYQGFEPDTNIAGVILNQVAHSRHEARLRAAIETYCDVPVLGIMPRSQELTIPDRHLGLVPQGEDDGLGAAVEAARRVVEERFDLERILEIARSAPPLQYAGRKRQEAGRKRQEAGRKRQEAGCKRQDAGRKRQEAGRKRQEAGCRIGVLRDRAFSFYYPENLEALEAAGAELVMIDSLTTPSLPDVQALYIGGGFPEVFLDQLEANRSLRQDLRQAIEDGLPVYAECGGLMYLARSIAWRGRVLSMVGALPCDVEMLDRPQGHGYVEARVVAHNPFLPKGQVLRGHEFHHSRVVRLDDGARLVYRLERGRGVDGRRDGLAYGNVLAAYTHVHALGTPGWAEGLVQRAQSTSKIP